MAQLWAELEQPVDSVTLFICTVLGWLKEKTRSFSLNTVWCLLKMWSDPVIVK